MEHATSHVQRKAERPDDQAPEVRGAPPPLHGGPVALLRFMRRNRMLNLRYGRLLVALLRRRYLTSYGRRLRTDGIAFIAPDVVFQIGPKGRVELGRWSWLGHGTKVRGHEGVLSIGGQNGVWPERTVF